MKISVRTHNEWDPLREVVVGCATGAQVPRVADESLHAVDYGALGDEEYARIHTGLYPKRVIEESNEDLDAFADALRKLGINVHRPAPADFTEINRTDDWAGYGN